MMISRTNLPTQCYATKTTLEKQPIKQPAQRSVVPALSLHMAALETHRIVNQQPQTFHYLGYLFH
jgi:hypothetical protein